MRTITWTAMKAFITARAISVQYADSDGNYYIYDDQGLFECLINKSTNTEDAADFESSYKPLGNKNPIQTANVQSVPFLGAKTIVINGATKRLFARDTGVKQAVTTGDNVIDYIAAYQWAKVVGVEVINCEALDVASLKVYDTASGTYSGVPNYMLNQFAFNMNMPKDCYRRMAQFDADIYPGMIVRVNYNSVSDKTVGINIMMNEVKT